MIAVSSIYKVSFTHYVNYVYLYTAHKSGTAIGII